MNNHVNQEATNAAQLSAGAFADAESTAPCVLFKRAKEVRQHFDEQGISIADWAEQRGFSVDLTRAILSGKRRCIRGQSHQIAVALGIKCMVTYPNLDSLISEAEISKEVPMET